METTAKPTIHQVLAWYSAIEKHVQIDGTESEIIKVAKENVEAYFLLSKLEHESYLTSIFHKMGIFLHPGMKKMPKLSEREQEEVRAEVKRRCQQYKINAEQPAPTQGDITHQSPSNHNGSFDALAEYMEVDTNNDVPSGTDIDTEMALYDEANIEHLNVDVLAWWAAHATKFPNLATLARFVFAIPASSAAPERNFSTAGYLVAERRSRLSPSNVENILISHSNYDLVGNKIHNDAENQ